MRPTDARAKQQSYCKSFALALVCDYPFHPERYAMYVCLCKAVTQQQIEDAVDQGQSYAQVRQSLGVATDCGCCGQAAKQMIRERIQQLPPCEFAEAS